MSKFSLFPHNFRLAKFFFTPPSYRHLLASLADSYCYKDIFHIAYLHIYIYSALCCVTQQQSVKMRSTKISLFILDNDNNNNNKRRRRRYTKSHFSIYPHFTQCNIYRHVYHYTVTINTTLLSWKNDGRFCARTLGVLLYEIIIKPENCGSMREERKRVYTHTRKITSHTINLMEWSLFHHFIIRLNFQPQPHCNRAISEYFVCCFSKIYI